MEFISNVNLLGHFKSLESIEEEDEEEYSDEQDFEEDFEEEIDSFDSRATPHDEEEPLNKRRNVRATELGRQYSHMHSDDAWQ